MGKAFLNLDYGLWPSSLKMARLLGSQLSGIVALGFMRRPEALHDWFVAPHVFREKSFATTAAHFASE
ncbi:MAG: hypothetical protein ABSF16_02450 [Terracidiphilus sp.]|jgi:hypothetical protein